MSIDLTAMRESAQLTIRHGSSTSRVQAERVLTLCDEVERLTPKPKWFGFPPGCEVTHADRPARVVGYSPDEVVIRYTDSEQWDSATVLPAELEKR